MTVSVVIFIIAVLIAAIWFICGFKRARHKFLAVFLIALILFSFLSLTAAFGGKDTSINSISDIGKVIKIYFSWFGNAFVNLKTITAQVVKMNWQGNITT